MKDLLKAVDEMIAKHERGLDDPYFGELNGMRVAELVKIKQLAIVEQQIQEKKLQAYATAAQKWEERFRALQE